ncbi:MAG: sulfatase [Candidatus Latescibacterota bacterium]|nr:MAG: sulfatase [Candidatus Latescibacterota bacterium]
MPTERVSKVNTLLGHMAVGVILGSVFGVMYFVLEPARLFAGRYEYLGAPLTQILVVYVVFGIFVGGTLGLLGGVVGALTGRWANVERYTPMYMTTLAFVLILVCVTGGYSMGAMKSLPLSKEMLLFLILLGCLTGIGYVIGHLLDRRRSFGRVGGKDALVFVGILVVAVVVIQLTTTRRSQQLPNRMSAATSDHPNVILIVLDALRPDHLSAYGYHRATSPNMERLARDGVLFLNAHSHGNRTIISMPAVFTSLYPSFHGAIGRGKLMRPLENRHTTIAELFQEAGYTTIAMMNNVYLKQKFGLIQGFDRIEEYHAERFKMGLYKVLRHLRVIERPRYATSHHPDADEVTRVALEWVRRIEGQPYFLYLHYMDTHHPYAPPPPYDTMYGDGEEAIGPLDLFKKTTRILREEPRVDLVPEDLVKLKDYYDGTIKFADDEIGRLVDEAVRLSGGRETIVVITADHGDEFLEHGSLYHNNLVIEELIHVPLIAWSSERFTRGKRVPGLVRHIDLLPTLAEIIGVDPPSQAMGQSLLPILEGQVDSVRVSSFAEGNFCASLNLDNWKIMRVDSTDSYYLFDLTRTPREAEDLSALYPDVFSRLKERLVKYLEKAKQVERAREAEADDDTIRELKALGYM